MAQVTGIGGIFFRARDPEALNDWYRTHLGITQPDVAVWMQEAGTDGLFPFQGHQRLLRRRQAMDAEPAG